MTQIVILGGGTAGTIMANRLRRLYAREVRQQATSISVIDRQASHVYQPGLLFVPFGLATPESLVKTQRRQLHPHVQRVEAGIDHVDTTDNAVVLEGGHRVRYDVLVVATGARLLPEETEGMTGPGWRERVFDFYTMEGATALRGALERFQGGRLVINVVDMPIKCPVAPLEFAFLADDYFRRRGIRDRVAITYATPLDNAFTKPTAARELAHLLASREIELVTEFNTGRVDGVEGKLVSWDDREIPFELLVAIPLHGGAEFVRRSPGLGDDADFVLTDPRTLQAKVAPNVFAIGDATNVAASKAGSVAHFQSEVLEENIRRYLAGQSLEPAFDGHANCFVETGGGKALLIDFNYEVEPLPGRFPLPVVGPLPLLRESRLNHLGKQAFRWIYWNVLLPGYNLPLVGPQMPLRGKTIGT